MLHSRVFSRIVVATTISFSLTCLSGCASILFPRLNKEGALQYSGGSGTVNCYSRPTDPITARMNARECVQASIEELDTLLENVGKTERVFSYTAVAAGTYAGIRLAKPESNLAPLKYTTIALASLAGFHVAVAPQRQREVLTAGVKAMQCLLDAADAVESANTQVSQFQTKAMPDLSHFGPQMLGATNALWAVAHQRNLEFMMAVQTENMVMPDQLQSATILIRSQIRSLLSSYDADIQQIYDAQKGRVNDMLGKIVANAGTAKQARNTTNAAFAILGKTDTVTDPGGADVVNITYQRCVAPINAVSGN